ncbi:MAG TPA: phospholipase D-like domain-containing protein [Polyangia bacterium]|nr:phospholipase D-like domain-containing protein [Polyangia bacterium]
MAFDFVDPRRPIAARLVGGRGHYEHVVSAVMEARQSVWIATANLKELMVEDHRAAPGRRRTARGGGSYRSVLAVFDELASRGVELRILHASPPSGPFQRELARHPALRRALAMRLCPRVHFKAVVVDGGFLYLGSANWTGAGLGAKGTGRRNFELGFATADDVLLDRVQALYEHVWRGAGCAGCKLREVCPAPLDGEPVTRGRPPDKSPTTRRARSTT